MTEVEAKRKKVGGGNRYGEMKKEETNHKSKKSKHKKEAGKTEVSMEKSYNREEKLKI